MNFTTTAIDKKDLQRLFLGDASCQHVIDELLDPMHRIRLRYHWEMEFGVQMNPCSKNPRRRFQPFPLWCLKQPACRLNREFIGGRNQATMFCTRLDAAETEHDTWSRRQQQTRGNRYSIRIAVCVVNQVPGQPSVKFYR